ncbi:helix-turn-helix transcriptional regulator [Bacillus sp. BRMEA1]|nr:helix-turn-helix transcriptional regulator [Neobacillus endophyticus]
MSIAKKLRMLRDKQNWSQETLANLMNMHHSTISRYERGKSIPDYQTLLRFAQVFKVEKDYLIQELRPHEHISAAPGFIAKESQDDPDFTLIQQMLQTEPALKKALVELYLMPPKRRAFFADAIAGLIKVNKHHKDKM